MGNSSTSTVLFQNIATPDSLIADIERAYQLGWIKNLTAKKTLLGLAQVGQKVYNYLEQIKKNNPRLVNSLKTQLIAQLKLLKLQLDFYKKCGWLKTEGATLLYQQIEYIIKNL